MQLLEQGAEPGAAAVAALEHDEAHRRKITNSLLGSSVRTPQRGDQNFRCGQRGEGGLRSRSELHRCRVHRSTAVGAIFLSGFLARFGVDFCLTSPSPLRAGRSRAVGAFFVRNFREPAPRAPKTARIMLDLSAVEVGAG